jgi:hypothetical protein
VFAGAIQKRVAKQAVRGLMVEVAGFSPNTGRVFALIPFIRYPSHL